MKGALLLVCVLIVLFILSRFIKFGRGYSEPDSEWNAPYIIDGVLTPEECRYIIEKATPMFTRSGVVGVKGADESRTSETAWISRDDPVARKVFAKAMEATGKTIEHCENLQIVKYEPGTYYRAHHDSCCEDSDSCSIFERDGGQRVATFLVYLNSEFTDGETHFPQHGDIKMKANPGSGIMFRPLGEEDDKCHPKALHAGLPISSGTKYVCNAWVRENKFRS
jgi:prolyl 4-hydroxylase